MFEAARSPAGMRPSRSPIHVTGGIEVAASPETVWRLVRPGGRRVDLLDGGTSFRDGTESETNLAGQDVRASVAGFEPISRIAWGGASNAGRASRAYHAWVAPPTPTGTHRWTEGTTQGPLWSELAERDPEVFRCTHQAVLRDPPAVALGRGRA